MSKLSIVKNNVESLDIPKREYPIRDMLKDILYLTKSNFDIKGDNITDAMLILADGDGGIVLISQGLLPTDTVRMLGVLELCKHQISTGGYEE